MADTLTKAKRSMVMAAVHSKGNRETELKLVAILRAASITGWRRHQTLPGRPDFVFPAQRLAIFVDGCFWHGCPRHCRMPAANARYWRQKISRNMARDRATVRSLKAAGWRVLRVWGHALRHPRAILYRINSQLRTSEERGKNTPTENELTPTDTAEFFAGIGLVRIGLENAGWSIAFANDIDCRTPEYLTYLN